MTEKSTFKPILSYHKITPYINFCKYTSTNTVYSKRLNVTCIHSNNQKSERALLPRILVHAKNLDIYKTRSVIHLSFINS